MIRNLTLCLTTLCGLSTLPGCFPRMDTIFLTKETAEVDSGDTGDVETGDTDGPDWEPDTGAETGVVPDSGKDTGPFETGSETGSVDTGPVDTGEPCTEVVWYPDMDGDGYGNVAFPEWDCAEDKDMGYVTQAGDYDDTDASVHWGPCQQTLADIGLEVDLRLETWNDLTLTVSLSETTQYALVYWYDSAAPRGYWISCGEVGGLTASMYVTSDTSVTEYYGNTYTEEASGAAEDWDQYLVTGAERSDGTTFEVAAYTTAAELVAVP